MMIRTGDDSGERHPERVRPPVRALVIGALVTIATGYWGFYVYNVARADMWSQTALMRGPVFVLFCLVSANLLLRALRVRFNLDQRELLIIYIMVVMGSAINGVSMLGFVVATTPALTYYGESFALERVAPLVPPHLIVHDPQVARDFYVGGTTAWTMRVMRAWASPALWWSSFILAMIFVILCLQVLVRKQWFRNERLTFPLAQIPLAITERAGQGLKGNRLFWTGFWLIATVQIYNGFTLYYPNLPHIQTGQHYMSHLRYIWPWSRMAQVLHLSFYPFMIGIAYLVRLDLSMSVVLFYWLTKAAETVFIMLGSEEAGTAQPMRYPLMDEQGIGAFIGLALVLMYTGRGRLREVALSALRGWQRDEDEMMSYRGAIVGALLGMGFVLWFMSRMGIAMHLALPTLLLMLVYLMMLSRIAAESGFGYLFIPENGASETVMYAVGTRNLPPRQIAALGYLYPVDEYYSDQPASHEMNAMKLGEASGMPARYVLLAVMIAAVVGLAADWCSQLDMYYRYGATTGKMRGEYWPRMGLRAQLMIKTYVEQGTPPDRLMVGGMAFGAGFVAALVKLRTVFASFPLHPIGYLIAGTPAARFLWLPFLLGGLIKLGVTRYGGLSLYRRLMPFFIGVIVGDNVAPAIWGVYGAISGRPTFQFFP